MKGKNRQGRDLEGSYTGNAEWVVEGPLRVTLEALSQQNPREKQPGADVRLRDP